MFKHVILSITVILLLMTDLAGQFNKFSFDRITIDDGLSQGTVTSIIQDSKGLMWFGTYDGLNCYDGVKFRIFKNNVIDSLSISHNNITSLCEDRFGNLWIGTMAGGLNIYNREKENFIRFQYDPHDSSSLSNNIINNIFEDSDGNIWVCTWGGGLNLYNREKSAFTHFRHDPENPNSVPSDFLNAIDQDSLGNLWLASRTGISKFAYKDSTFKNYAHDPDDINSISDNDVSTIFAGPEGYIWAGTWGHGLNRFDPKTETFKRFLHDPDNSRSLGHNIIRSIFADKLGHLYAATWGGGLDLFGQEGSRFFHVRHEATDDRSISGDFIYTIYLDKTGILWIGTDYKGVNKYDHKKQKFTHFKKSPGNKGGLNSNTITSFVEDDYDNIWLGSSNGLNHFNSKTEKFRNYVNNPRDHNSLSNNVIKTMARDHKYIWLGTELGLNRFNPISGKFKHYQPNPDEDKSVSYHVIRNLFVDSENTLWVGTYSGGLNKYNRKGDSFTHYKYVADSPDSLSSNFVWSILEDKQDYLWIGTDDGGVNRFDREKNIFKTFRHDPLDPNTISDNKVLCILEGSDGILWFGTAGGLNRFDQEKDQFKSYYTNNGLPSNSIQGILEDESHNLWISTTNGLSKFNPDSGSFQNFNESNGLQSNEFGVNSCLKTQNNLMFFGGINGFNVFNPAEIKRNPFIPPVIITDFHLFNKKVNVSRADQRTVLEKSILETDAITLAYDQNVFSFEFASLSYSHPRNNQYAYMMENFDSDWNIVGNRSFATYTNLPPGSYVFKVKGTNNDGIWNDTGTSIRLHITPPYWQTWWFRVLAIGLAVYILVAYLRFRTRIFKQQNIALENAVKKKTLEMKDLMDKMIRQEKLAAIGKISGSIAHELRNPLGAVKQSAYYLRMILKEPAAKVEKHLNLIENELNIADKVIDDLMEMTRVQSANKKIISIQEIVTDAIERVDLNDAISVQLEIAENAREIWADVIQIRQVLVNLIINAKQAIEETGTITITSSLSKDAQYVKLAVSDSGAGIKEESLDKIFEPLYTTKAKGTGLGLNICKQIIEKHDGDISISSKPGKGTTVFILLPHENGS